MKTSIPQNENNYTIVLSRKQKWPRDVTSIRGRDQNSVAES